MEPQAQGHPESNSNHVVAGIRPVSLLKIIALEPVRTIYMRMNETRLNITIKRNACTPVRVPDSSIPADMRDRAAR